jgi:hypothetical protein
MDAKKTTLMECYIDEFFNQLEIYEDIKHSNNFHRQQLVMSIIKLTTTITKYLTTPRQNFLLFS